MLRFLIDCILPLLGQCLPLYDEILVVHYTLLKHTFNISQSKFVQLQTVVYSFNSGSSFNSAILIKDHTQITNGYYVNRTQVRTTVQFIVTIVTIVLIAQLISTKVKACVQRKSKLIRAVVNCGIRFGRHNLFLGHNALIYAHRYKISFSDIRTDCAINPKVL